jgi:hypothetical protein
MAVEGVKIDIWETDSSGHYDVQYSERDGPDGRCVMKSDAKGVFWFKAIVPVPYPIPHDGPVGQLLKLLKRHPWRPAHMHFMFEKPGWDHLITPVLLLLLMYVANTSAVRFIFVATHMRLVMQSLVSRIASSLSFLLQILRLRRNMACPKAPRSSSTTSCWWMRRRQKIYETKMR